MLRQQGVPLDLIAKQLGHKDLRQTAIYARIATIQVRDAVNCLDSVLSDLKATGGEKVGEISGVSHLN